MKTGILILLAFAALNGSISGQEADFKPVANGEMQLYMARIEKASAGLTSLQCSFTQKKNISILAESVVSTGRLLFKKNDKLCWEYVSPYKYIFVLNGDKIYIKNEKSLSTFDTRSNALFKEISMLMVNSISGAGLIDEKKFEVGFYESPGIVQARLTPRNKTLKSMMSAIILNFEKKTYQVHSIEMAEPSGDNTTIIFSEVQINLPISDEKFVVRQ